MTNRKINAITATISNASGGNTMKSRIVKSMLSAACALAPLAVLAPTTAQAQSVIRPAQDISLSIGNGQLINVPGKMSDVFVANEAVADVQVKSTNQFYVFGKGGGTTTVYASNAHGDIIWSGNIRVGSNLDSVDSMLALAMPEARIGVSTMGTEHLSADRHRQVSRGCRRGRTPCAGLCRRGSQRHQPPFDGDAASGEPAGSLCRSQPHAGARDRHQYPDQGRDRRYPVRRIARPCRLDHDQALRHRRLAACSMLRGSMACRRERSLCHSIRRPASSSPAAPSTASSRWTARRRWVLQANLPDSTSLPRSILANVSASSPRCPSRT